MMNRNGPGGGRGKMGPGLLGNAPGYGGQGHGGQGIGGQGHGGQSRGSPRENMSVGMQRMLGGNVGLLGSAPSEAPGDQRMMMQQPPKPPPSLLDTAGVRNRQNFGGGILDTPDMGLNRDRPEVFEYPPHAEDRERQPFRRAGMMDQTNREGRERQNFERGGLFNPPHDETRERPNFQGGIIGQANALPGGRDRQNLRAGGPLEQPLDVGMRERQKFRAGFRDLPDGGMRDPQNFREGILDQLDEDLRERPQNFGGRGIFDRPDIGMRERQNSKPGLLDVPPMRRGHLEDHNRHASGMLDRQNSRGGLLEDPPCVAADLMDHPDVRRGLRDHDQDNRVGLLDRAEMLGERDAQGRPMNRPGIMERPEPNIHGRLIEQQPDMMRRGLMHQPEPNIGFLDMPPLQRGGFQEREQQANLLEKAEIQMRLLEQERRLEMEASQQQILHEKQQQALTQQQLMMQAKAMIEHQKKGRASNDGLLGSGPMSQQGGLGGIPSIFDLPTPAGQSRLRKRAGGPGRQMDNKRPRQEPSNSRGQNDRDQLNRRDSRENRGRDRQTRDADRRKSRFHTSPSSSKRRERKESESKRRSSSRVSTPSKDGKKEDGKTRAEKTADKVKAEQEAKGDRKDSKMDEKVEVTIDLTEKYDPAQPTGDSDDKADSEGKMETEAEDKDKDDAKKDEETHKPKEISLTVTINKKGRSVNDADKMSNDPPAVGDKKYIKCNVCMVDCDGEESFARHMNGKKHKTKMGLVMTQTNHKQALANVRKQAEEHLRQIEAQKKGNLGKPAAPGKALETLCKTCDKKFAGAFKDHKESAEHKARENRRKAGCKVCKVEYFNSFTDYTKHLKSNWHMKNKRQASWPECKMCDQRFKSPRKFVQHCKTDHHIKNKKKFQSEDDDMEEEDLGDLVTLDTIGFEEDLSVLMEGDKPQTEDDNSCDDFSKAEPVTPKASESAATSTPKTVIKRPMQIEATITPVRTEEVDSEIPEEFDPDVVVGQKYVVSVTGFFCKLCQKFYNNEMAAKITHCRTKTHYDKLKKVMAEKLESRKQKETSVSVQDSAQLESLDKSSSQTNGIADENAGATQEAEKMEATQQDILKEVNQGDASKEMNQLDASEEVSQRDVSSFYETADEHQDSTMGAEMSQDTDNDTLDATEDEVEEIADDAELGLKAGSPGIGRGSSPKGKRGKVNARGQRARRGRKL